MGQETSQFQSGQRPRWADFRPLRNETSARVAVVGSHGCGKTTLLRVIDPLQHDHDGSYQLTLRVFSSKDIWRDVTFFEAKDLSYCYNVSGILLMFDVTSRTSFQTMCGAWGLIIKDIFPNLSALEIPVVVIASKCDRPAELWQVSKKELRHWCKTMKVLQYYTAMPERKAPIQRPRTVSAPVSVPGSIPTASELERKRLKPPASHLQPTVFQLGVEERSIDWRMAVAQKTERAHMDGLYFVSAVLNREVSRAVQCIAKRAFILAEDRATRLGAVAM